MLKPRMAGKNGAFLRNLYSDNVDKHSSEEEHAAATIASLVRGFVATLMPTCQLVNGN